MQGKAFPFGPFLTAVLFAREGESMLIQTNILWHFKSPLSTFREQGPGFQCFLNIRTPQHYGSCRFPANV